MIRTRDQLLDHIGQHASRSIRRALAEGTVEFLGGFNTDPPCWIVRVTSTFKHVWNIGVTADGKIRTESYVNWRLWGTSVLGPGDNPKQYERLRDTARRLDVKKTS